MVSIDRPTFKLRRSNSWKSVKKKVQQGQFVDHVAHHITKEEYDAEEHQLQDLDQVRTSTVPLPDLRVIVVTHCGFLFDPSELAEH